MSKISFLSGALVFLGVLGVSLQAQPLAQYTFNDGTAKDISGNGLDGVLLGNAAIVADPERGQVLQINQSGMQANGPFAITTSFTLSAWIKLDQPRPSPGPLGRDQCGARTAERIEHDVTALG